MILALFGSAVAAEPCSFDPAEVATAAQAIDTALEADDMVGAGATWRALQARLKCIDGPMPAGIWADLLIDLGLLELGAGMTTWTQPVQVATEIRPDVKRDIGPMEFRRFVPTMPPDPGPALPTNAHYWLDGARIDREPTLLGGPHVVQQEWDGVWTTLVLRDAPFPDYWKTAEVIDPGPAAEAKTQGSTSAFVWALGGGRGTGQRIDATIPELATQSSLGALIGLAVHGRIQRGLPGAFWDASAAGPVGGPLGASAAAGGSLGSDHVALLVGGAGETAVIEQSSGDALVVVPRPHLGVTGQVPVGSWSLESAVGGGWTLATTSANAWLGFAPTGKFGASFGIDAGYSATRFDEKGGSRRVDTSRWWLGAGLGGALGR